MSSGMLGTYLQNDMKLVLPFLCTSLKKERESSDCSDLIADLSTLVEFEEHSKQGQQLPVTIKFRLHINISSRTLEFYVEEEDTRFDSLTRASISLMRSQTLLQNGAGDTSKTNFPRFKDERTDLNSRIII